MTRFFGLDLRSVALMRITLSLAILWDLFSRLRYSPEFLWGQALGTPEANLSHFHLNFIPSIHILSTSLLYQGTLMGLHALLAVALLLGWKTKWVTPSLWYLTLSLHFSNEPILNGGDYLLRQLLFVGMFLPWGRVYSLDSRQEKTGHGVVADGATVLLLAQICLLYWSSAMLKTEPSWVGDYTALYYALSLDTFATPLGLELSHYPGLLKALTAVVYWTEWIAPLLLLLGHPALRLLGIALLSILHLGIILTLTVGLFWLVPLTALFALLPSEFWDYFTPEPREPDAATHLPPALQAGLGLLALLLAYLNLTTNRSLRLNEPLPLYTFTRTVGLHYGWGMFTKITAHEDGWIQAVATFQNQKQRDLLWDLPATPDRPKNWALRYPNQRWRRYLLNLRDERFRVHRAPFLAYLRDRWSKSQQQDIQRLELWLWKEPTPPDYRDVEPKKVVLFTSPNQEVQP